MEENLNDLLEMFGTSEVFSHLSPKDHEGLARIASKKHLKRGESLLHQGDLWPHVLLILEGQLKSSIASPDGRSFVTGIWDAGMEFWGHTLFDGDEMPSTTEATSDMTGYLWNGEDALRYVLQNSDAARALLRRQTRMIRKRRELIYNLAFNPVTSRTAKLIIDMFAGTGEATIQRELTLEEMSMRIATSPEVVCRVLHQFQENGFVQMKRATITLSDRRGLENLISN